MCEEHLPVKPAVARSGCVRLGQSDGHRPRRLLVHLTSESSASSLLAAAKELQHSDDAFTARNIYINPDLSPAEAKLAFELRERRRATRAAATTTPTTTTTTATARPTQSHLTESNKEADQGTSSNSGCSTATLSTNPTVCEYQPFQ